MKSLEIKEDREQSYLFDQYKNKTYYLPSQRRAHVHIPKGFEKRRGSDGACDQEDYKRFPLGSLLYAAAFSCVIFQFYITVLALYAWIIDHDNIVDLNKLIGFAMIIAALEFLF